MKEEKEVLEHFAGVFTMMNPLTFKEIFQTTVPYMVERISKNYALQVLMIFFDDTDFFSRIDRFEGVSSLICKFESLIKVAYFSRSVKSV